MSKLFPPYRADHVGSFLRPEKIASARNMYFKNLISKEALTLIEDEEIAKLVKLEEANGLKAVTDGEFRRAYWHLDFLAALDGIEHISAKNWSTHFEGVQPKAETIKISGKIGFSTTHPFVDALKRLINIVGDAKKIKFTIPSPSMLYQICVIRNKDYEPIELYKNNDELLFSDIANAWIDAAKTFYDLGLRYLQIDDTSWGEFCSEEKTALYSGYGRDLKYTQEQYVKVINKIREALPEDMTLTMHICRGNFRSTWFSSGGYESVAELLFGSCKIDAFFLEYDSDRAGDFKPLRFIKDQTVVLGLITSKFPELEDKNLVKERIREATEYVPLNQLCLSTQCGFSSTEEGNVLTQEEQWAKIRLVNEIAHEVWADA